MLTRTRLPATLLSSTCPVDDKHGKLQLVWWAVRYYYADCHIHSHLADCNDNSLKGFTQMRTSQVQNQMPTDVSISKAAQNAQIYYLHLFNSGMQSGLYSRLVFIRTTWFNIHWHWLLQTSKTMLHYTRTPAHSILKNISANNFALLCNTVDPDMDLLYDPWTESCYSTKHSRDTSHMSCNQSLM